MMIRFWIILILASLCAATTLADTDTKSIIDNKQELDKVKKQLVETRGKVDSLLNLEHNLVKTISSYDDKVSRNRLLVGRLNKQLLTVRGELGQNKQDLILTGDRLSRMRNGYLNLIKDYYIYQRSNKFLDDLDINALLNANRLSRYLAAISSVSTREIVQAGDSVKRLNESMDSLSQTGSEISDLKNKKQSKINLDLTLKKKEESSLSGVRKQSNIMRDRLISLSEMATQMEEIIAELEKEQARRRRAGRIDVRYQSGSFASLKGLLSPPVKGKIVSSFGWKVNKVTNLKSFSPGIDIAPRRGLTKIAASAPGRIAYVGTLRGYSNFVIIEHDDGYYTTYAGMSSVNVETDDLIFTGEILGSAGEGNIHFELRKGREHLDPVIWLDINEF